MGDCILGTNVVTQIGILCRDIETTAKAYGDFFGQEYTIMTTGPQEEAGTKYYGKDTPARCRQVFFKVGDQVEIELIEPDEHPSVWRDDLDKHGEGFHHIAFWVKDTDQILARLDAAGMPLRQKGGWPGGRYAYVDASETLKFTLETLENFIG